MDYIRTNYVTVPPKQLQENEIALNAQWDPTTPVVLLFTRIEDCKLFSKYVEDPCTDKKILCSAYLTIEDTGLFNLPCDTWRENPQSAKNLINFNLFFTKEAANIKHHTTGSVRLNDESDNAILKLINTLAAQQHETANMRAVQVQPVNNASEYKDLRSKVDGMMSKINSTKLQHH